MVSLGCLWTELNHAQRMFVTSLVNYSTTVRESGTMIKKITFIFSSDFETLFTKRTPCEILGLNFEKKTVYLNYNFPIQWSAIITPERIQ